MSQRQGLRTGSPVWTEDLLTIGPNAHPRIGLLIWTAADHKLSLMVIMVPGSKEAMFSGIGTVSKNFVSQHETRLCHFQLPFLLYFLPFIFPILAALCFSLLSISVESQLMSSKAPSLPCVFPLLSSLLPSFLCLSSRGFLPSVDEHV